MDPSCHGMDWGKNENLWGKTHPMALCPPQIPCGLFQGRNHLCHGAAFKQS